MPMVVPTMDMFSASPVRPDHSSACCRPRTRPGTTSRWCSEFQSRSSLRRARTLSIFCGWECLWCRKSGSDELPSPGIEPASLMFKQVGGMSLIGLEREDVSELVETVERSHFICFCQRRIIENRIAKVFHRTVQGKHGLAYMNDLGGTITDGVHAEQLQIVRIEQDL